MAALDQLMYGTDLDVWGGSDMDLFMPGGYNGSGVGIDYDPWGGISIGGSGTGGGVYIPIGGGGTARERAVQLVNASEYTLQQNILDLNQGRISRAEAISNFDLEWSRLVSLLQQLGAEGTRAIADRQRGGKFDWFAAYRPQESGTGAGTGLGGIFNGGTGGVNLAGVTTGGGNQLFLVLVMGLVAYLLFKR
jgi:hypothetical protein